MSAVIAPKNITPFNSRQGNKAASTASRSSQKFQEALAAATKSRNNPATGDTQPASADKNYAVLQGDTLSEIVAAESRKLGVNHSTRELYAMVDRIAARNQLANPDKLMPGQELDLGSLTTIDRNQAGRTPPEPSVHFTSAPSTVTGNRYGQPPQTTMQSPLTGKITSLFGMRTHPVLGETLHHDGIDISGPTGTPVKPLSAGVVTFAGDNGGYGLMVEVEHENGLTSRYAHLSALAVRKGERINPDQTIGQVGQTGLATGPHLHLEILRRDTPIDPLTVLDRGRIEPGLLVAGARTSYRR
jgi:murein DD-endopeptidase MepM/ murein hydrolase activator NlpD